MKHLKKLATTLNKNCLSFIATLALFVTYNGVNTACYEPGWIAKRLQKTEKLLDECIIYGHHK